MLTQQQQAWVSMQKVLAGVHMQHQPPPPRQKLRAAVHRVVTHSVFEGFIMAVIVVNVLFMAMVHADMSLQWQVRSGGEGRRLQPFWAGVAGC